MEFYKETDFKEEPMIGKVAIDWQVVKLEEALLLLRNGLTTTQNKEGNGYSVTRIETISEEDIDPSKVGYIHDLSESEINEYRLRDGDILFSHINSLDHIGKTAIYEEKPKLLIHGMNLLLLRPDKERIHPRFMLYLLRLCRMKNIFRAMAKKAVNQASINQTELGRVKILCPPLDEQLGIVGVLGVVDLAVAKAGEVIAKTERLKKGLMQELLTKGIGHTEYKHSKELGYDVPKDWEIKKFEEVSKVRQGLQIAISDRHKEKGQNRHVYITIQYLNNPSDERNLYYIENPKPSVVCKKDDILLTRTGNTGVVVTGVEGVFHNNFFLIDYDRRILSREFLYYYLNHDKIQNLIKIYAGSTTVPDLDHGDFYRIPVAIPSLSEQRKIAEFLSMVDKKLEFEREEKERLERIKKGLMDLLLTGKVRVKVD